MAINLIETAAVFQSQLDKQLLQSAVTGWMEPNSALIKYNGGAEIKIPSMTLQGLGDYDRSEGHPDGAVTVEWETKRLTQDRGRVFYLDSNDTDETNFVVTAGAVMGEFQRAYVVPEVDA